MDFWLLKHGGAQSAECILQLLRLVVAEPRSSRYQHRQWTRERKTFDPKALSAASKKYSAFDQRVQIRLPFEPLTSEENQQGIVRPYEIVEPETPTAQPQSSHPLQLLPPPEETKHEQKSTKDIPSRARWTKINRRLVSPKAVKLQGLRFQTRPNSVIVFKVMTRDEISELAEITYEMRRHRRSSFREEGQASDDALSGSEDDTSSSSLDLGKASSLGRKSAASEHLEGSKQERKSSEGPEARRTPGWELATQPTKQRAPSRSESTERNRTEATDRQVDPTQKPHEIGREEADEGMKTLLVYRAVLFAALGAMAADTSCVFGTELGRRVVQVL